ncbi:MAG: 2-amino-4-hydroxy-6-hydroxymethyldihydropteridine diphosphokinase [Acidobacteriia bacterium]|nr:2-amino-4-hydroxy-6-hydroxymethyldihydropteridine diphosphokinase [Terriglobia bacterium]
MKRVFLSLGSNLGDRVAHLQRTIDRLSASGLAVQRVSALYRTEPVDFQAQSWFVNCVVEVATDLMPMQLLKTLKGLERALGRRPGVSKGPRAIDIDILLYENVVVRSAALTIPHARLSQRRFVLAPLRDLEPHLRHPLTQRSVIEMLAETADKSQVIRLKEEL